MKNKKSIYQRANDNGCHLEATCVSITADKWAKLMKGARQANQKRVVKAAVQAGILTNAEGRREIKHRYYNPYSHHVTRTHIVYVHSGIEHFIRVN